MNTFNIDVEKLDISIQMLEEHVKEDSIKPLLAALKALRNESSNESLVTQLLEAFDSLGIVQGAVLTYAPYIGILVTDHSSYDKGMLDGW